MKLESQPVFRVKFLAVLLCCCFQCAGCDAWSQTVPLSGKKGVSPVKTTGISKAEVVPISPGQCLQGTLEPGDETLSDGTYFDRYSLNWPGGDLTITLDSPAFDEYLIVRDPNDDRVDVDNFYEEPEVFERTNAIPGSYEIWANSYDPAVGNYTLCIGDSSGTPSPTNTPTITPTPTVCTSPVSPSNPNPPSGTSGVPLDVTLTWVETAKTYQKVIYGNDDRMDIYEVTDPNVLEAVDGTVVLVSPSSIRDNGDGTYTLNSRTFNEEQGGNLCPDEPYRDQPAPGFCSGFLVAPNIVVTAGHCVTSQSDCGGSTVIVFGFHMLDSSTPRLTVPEDDVYRCFELIQTVQDPATGADWAVLRLDREVVGHAPVRIRREGRIPDNQSVFVIGHPAGLPKKVAGGANVRTNSSGAFFVANLDTYGGNSGSPVFNASTYVVEGILVRGENDFVNTGSCIRSNVCPDDGCRGEDCTRTTLFAHLIPELMTFDVYFGPCGNLSLVGTVTRPRFRLPSLLPNTTHCWKVVANKSCGSAESSVWSFTTVSSSSTPTPRPTAVNPGADENSDGSIDSKDLLELARQFKTATPPVQKSLIQDLYLIAGNWRRSVP